MFKNQRFLRWENDLWRMYYILCIPAWEWKVFRSGHLFLLFVGLSKERKLAEEVLNGLKSKAGRRPPSASTVCLNQIRQCSSSTDFSADLGLRVFFFWQSQTRVCQLVRARWLFWRILLEDRLHLAELPLSTSSAWLQRFVLALMLSHYCAYTLQEDCQSQKQDMQMLRPLVSMFLVLYCDLTTGDRRVFL